MLLCIRMIESLLYGNWVVESSQIDGVFSLT
jgi:hypothetical protein